MSKYCSEHAFAEAKDTIRCNTFPSNGAPYSDELPDLSGKRIFMSARLLDPIVTKQEAEKLSKLFEQVGASVIILQ